MSDKPVIYMLDDDLAILDSMQFMLQQFGYEILPFNTANSFFTQCNVNMPGCLILDSRMPEMTGQAVHSYLLEANSPLGVIFLTGHGDLPMAVNAFRQGACDFFQKPVSGKELVIAIEKALISSQQAYELGKLKQCYANLTERELQVLQQLIDGKTNKQMAESLFVSIRTIEVHRAKLIKKLNIHNAAELAKFGSLLAVSH